MTALESVVLWTHIAFGVVALGAGVGALVATKGSVRHIRSGQVFVASMAIVLGLVPVLLVLDPTVTRQILTLVAIFTGYFLFAGYRTVTRKHQSSDADPIDWVAVGLLLVVGVGLVGWGVGLVLAGEQFGLVLTVFGVIAVGFGISDARRFRTPTNPEWLMDHLGRMVGAYIATVTAVSATNLMMLPTVARWLWPTAVGVPLILYWQAKYGNTGPLARWIAG